MVNKILKTWNKILSRIFSGKTIHKSGNKILFHPLKNLFHGLQILLAILFYSSENFVRMASKNFVPWPPKFRTRFCTRSRSILQNGIQHGGANFSRGPTSIKCSGKNIFVYIKSGSGRVRQGTITFSFIKFCKF